MTVNKLIEKLLTLRDEGYGELPCVYSHDDEANVYQAVSYEASLLEVHDLEKRYLDPVSEGENYNCVIIN